MLNNNISLTTNQLKILMFDELMSLHERADELNDGELNTVLASFIKILEGASNSSGGTIINARS